MMRHWLGSERGFTLVELLVVVILVGILAAIALAVFLNQEDKGRDADAKSNVNNLTRLVQACNSGRDGGEDFRNCDTPAELGTTGLAVVAPGAPSPGDNCGDPPPSEAPSVGQVRVFTAGPNCFTVVGTSKSGNVFWYIKNPDGSYRRNCSTRGVNGCPSDGQWAG